MTLYHENRQPKPPHIEAEDISLQDPCAYGSEVIASKLDDPEFAKYRVPAQLHPSGGLSKAICRAKAYIEACSGPEAPLLDPEVWSIGGRIHIATITPADGFQWVDGFDPI